MIRTALAAASVAALALVVVAASQARAQLGIQLVASGFSAPTYVTSAPGEPNALYVVEQPGTIKVLVGGRVRPTPFLDIRARVKAGGEQGLLSVAFHPDYARNRLFYVDYTDTNGDTRVVQFRSNGTAAIPSSAKQLLFVDQPYDNHNGGQLQFGPDRLLYVGMGDGGSGGDPGNRAQNLSVPLGKLLRTNPLAAKPRWTAAGYGLRNPWRFSFDRRTGDLWIGDVGQGSWEEVDRRTRAQLARRWNYGWSVLEGRHKFKDEALNRDAPLVAPILEYSHDGGRCSITGGYVYRGTAVPSARGRYFYGDYCTGEVWSTAGGAAPREERFRVGTLASFGEDAAGELYLVSLDGKLYRLKG